MNIKITFQYEGTRYHGWQRQKNTTGSIQEKVEHVLSDVLCEEVEVAAAGRTDMGVHARGQVLNFKTPKEVDPVDLMQKANELLPYDIRFLCAEQVPERFHARLNAVGKHYEYRISLSQKPDVFCRRYEWDYKKSLDLAAMQKAISMLCGTHDFRALCDEKKKERSCVRTIERIELNTIRPDALSLDFYGDGFLYHMVRKLSALLVEVGSGRMEPEGVLAYFSPEAERFTGLAPALGLSLVEVYY